MTELTEYAAQYMRAMLDRMKKGTLVTLESTTRSNEEFTTVFIPEHVAKQIAEHVERLERDRNMWKTNALDTRAAMTAMRNEINEKIPMPSIESDLLCSPENSVFCAALALSVVQHMEQAHHDRNKLIGTMEQELQKITYDYAKQVEKCAKLEKQLEKAKKVIEPFALIYSEGVASTNETYSTVRTCTGYFRAAHMWKEQSK